MFVLKWYDGDECITRYDSVRLIDAFDHLELVVYDSLGYTCDTADEFNALVECLVKQGYDMARCEARASFETGEFLPLEWHK